jgi:hypothetical protein
MFMFGGICTLHIFAIFEWQKAFLNIKNLAILNMASVAQW